MAALDFPASPTVGQIYNGTNGVAYTWDGTVWTVPLGGAQLWTDTGTALTPVDATKRVVIPGPTASGANQSALTLGTRTPKAHLAALPGLDWGGFSYNRYYDGTAWQRGDTTKSGWALSMQASATAGSGDDFSIAYVKPDGSTGPYLAYHGTGGFDFFGQSGTLLTLDNAGKLTTNGDAVWGAANAVRTSLLTGAHSSWVTLNNVFGPDVSGESAWGMSMETSGAGAGDQITFGRRAVGGGGPVNQFTLSNAGNLTIAGPTATKQTGTTWANPSDPRLKDDVAPYAAGLAEISQLAPITYRLKSAPDRECYGFDASAVRDVFPECVSTTRMKLDPSDEEETDDVLTFDMHPILVAVINALKEVETRLAALEAR